MLAVTPAEHFPDSTYHRRRVVALSAMKSTKRTQQGADSRIWSPALTALYTDHFDYLVGCARRVLHDHNRAEDVVQDCFLRFALGTAEVGPGKERSYLHTMVRNQSITELRRDACALRTAEALASRDAGNASPAEDHVIEILESERLASKLDELSDRQRRVVSMRYVAGLSVSETADRVGVSPGTVKAHTHRGAHALRASFAAA